MSAAVRPPVFALSEPLAPEAPLLFDSPHSGLDWPENFGTTASREAILSTWDAYVDELWGDAPLAGATLLAGKFPRAYIDVNRAADDIDPSLLSGPWPVPLATTDYSRRGMGLIRRYALPGVPMYGRLLAPGEVQGRLADYYWPYRDALRARLDGLYARHGAVWHVNCHSMKSRGNDMNTDSGELRPDFVVSDQLGRTTDPALTRWAADWFAGRGFSVKINDPYRGGNLIGTTGQPARRRHSIQIEINRRLYMDESTFVRGERFAGLRAELGRFAQTLATHVRSLLLKA